MSNARNLADLLSSTGDVKANRLSNVPAADLVNDTTPQLGGTLDCNGFAIDFGDWTITETAGVLKFATGGVNKAKLDASGNFTVVGDVTAFGTI
jgi:hypothetical protein